MGRVTRRWMALALLGALAACSESGNRGSIPDVASFRVTARDLRVSVNEKGTLKAKRQLLVRPNVPGQAKIVSLVEEGITVEEGDVVCELDSTDIVSKIEDLRNRIINLALELMGARTLLCKLSGLKRPTEVQSDD